LDTHEVVKELRAVGFADEQAEAVPRVIRSSQDIDLSNLVTKTDLQLTKTELQNELASVTTDLQNGQVAVRAEFAADHRDVPDRGDDGCGDTGVARRVAL
jgi:propanediol dehydratase small subunit